MKNQILKQAGIQFPDFWDEDKVINALTTMDTYDLYDYFGCSNSTSFTRMMKPHMPKRPERTSYAKYIRDLLAEPEVLDPSQKEFARIYKIAVYARQPEIDKLSPEDQERYAIWDKQMKESAAWKG